VTAQLDLLLDPPDPPMQRRTAALTSHHVRAHETAEEALAGDERARAQEASILGYFQAFAATAAVDGATPGRFTPSEVHAMFPAWPITSIRRAITNLTRAGHLRHFPADRRPGPRGAREGTWGLA
jgi:hypothetical protein